MIMTRRNAATAAASGAEYRGGRPVTSNRDPRAGSAHADTERHAGSRVQPRLTLARASSTSVARMEALSSRWSATAAVGFTGAAALAFVLVRPPVGDFWAAQARQYA